MFLGDGSSSCWNRRSDVRSLALQTPPRVTTGRATRMAGRFLFYVMPYLEGESLRDRIDREKQLPVDEAVDGWPWRRPGPHQSGPQLKTTLAA